MHQTAGGGGGGGWLKQSMVNQSFGLTLVTLCIPPHDNRHSEVGT